MYITQHSLSLQDFLAAKPEKWHCTLLNQSYHVSVMINIVQFQFFLVIFISYFNRDFLFVIGLARTFVVCGIHQILLIKEVCWRMEDARNIDFAQNMNF